jgi:putative FmdB family regulatory protein
MPLYEYACQSCDHHFDMRHSADDKPALNCPVCQGSVRKVFHAAGIIFKGSGWYIKDSAPKEAASTDVPAKPAELAKPADSAPAQPAAAATE